MKLLVNALIKFTLGLLMVGLLMFLPAGTLDDPQGWLFVGLLFVPMLIAGFVMLFRSPDFLAKRLDAKEKPMAAQRSVFAVNLAFFKKKPAYSTNQGFPKIHEIATPVCALARNDSSFESAIN